MPWLEVLSWAMLALGFLCALIIVLDILAGHPQHMGIMNLMYGWMAIVAFLIFGYEHRPHADSPVFWFMMQIGMMCGFLTAYPINWLLLTVGWKEKM